VGSHINDFIGTTTLGALTGLQLLQDFASSPRFAFFSPDFSVLVNETLTQVLDLLCFYVIDVQSPLPASCYSGGAVFTVKGYNFFPMGSLGGTPQCRWQQVGTSNFLYTNANISVTNQTYGNEPGVVGLVTCPAPLVTVDPYNAYLEISRDGTYYTNNQYSVLLRADCTAPVPAPPCPNATIAALFSTCNATDFKIGCSLNCNNAAMALEAAFQAQSIYPNFTPQQIKVCIANVPSPTWASTDKDLLSARTAPNQNPCVVAATSGAGTVVVSLVCLVCGVLFN